MLLRTPSRLITKNKMYGIQCWVELRWSGFFSDYTFLGLVGNFFLILLQSKFGFSGYKISFLMSFYRIYIVWVQCRHQRKKFKLSIKKKKFATYENQFGSFQFPFELIKTEMIRIVIKFYTGYLIKRMRQACSRKLLKRRSKLKFTCFELNFLLCISSRIWQGFHRSMQNLIQRDVLH